jgi:AcrR family transcriptional regulator
MTSKGRVGRPSDPAIGEALREAAEEVLTHRGYPELKVDRLVRQVGTTRAAFHRRYSGTAHLALDILLRRFGDAPVEPTGRLFEDLLTLESHEVRMFADPLFHNIVFGLIMANDPKVMESFGREFDVPRRENLRAVLDAALARGDLAAEPESFDYVCELMFGPLLAKIMGPGPSPDEATARRIATTVHRELTAG